MPTDLVAHHFPVSVKGVILVDGCVVLVGNSRAEWELPGGKLEPAETPEACVAREIREELAIDVLVGPLLDAWVYRVADGVQVLVLAYGCDATPAQGPLGSPEGHPVGHFRPDALPERLPDGYRPAIERWKARCVVATAGAGE